MPDDAQPHDTQPDDAQPDDTDALHDAAAALLRQGRVPEAIAAHQRLLQAVPGDADAWYNLGYLLQRAARFEAALAAYDQALAHDIGDPEEVQLNRAVVLADELGRWADAERALGLALSRNPRYGPAWMNLGMLRERLGDRAGAGAAFEQLLRLDPQHALALSRLPHLVRVESADAPLVRRLRAALARPGLSAADQADLGFGLGKALDDAGAYDAAFAAYQAANAASRAAGGDVRYDRHAHEARVDALIAGFPQPAVLPGALGDAPRMIFVCGLFRSGSTLLERMLAGHPEVTAGGELDLLPALVRQHRQAGGRLPPDAATLRRWREHYLQAVSARFPGARWLTDKRPDNFLHIGLIQGMFPDARIVHTHRHPLDNALSQYFLHLAHTMPHALDLNDIAHWQQQHGRLMAHWHRMFGGQIHEVDYDRLVRDPAAELVPLLAACGLPWNDEVLQFHRQRGSVATPSAWQVREALYQRASGRWRHYARQLAEVPALRPTIEGQPPA